MLSVLSTQRREEIVKARELLVNVDRVWNRNPLISSVIDAVSEQHGVPWIIRCK